MTIHFKDTKALTEAPAVQNELRIRGSGGGGKGKGGGGKDASNTLRSKARARMIELISEGVIEGLVDGEKSIYFEQTPLRNSDGTYNFKNVIWQEHKGLPDEGHFPGHAGVETPHNVEVQVKRSVGPVQRTIVDPNADAVRVLLRLPSLFYQDKKKGEMRTTSVAYQVQVRANAGVWTTAVEKRINNEKCTSPYQIAHRVELPIGGSPWDIRIVRLTADSDKVELQNDLYWEGYVTIVDGKFIYPNSAAIGLELNGEDMGQSIPARSFHVRGLKVLVPANYNPLTRAYTGIWDGTFKRAWTNNPAWVFYDLIINDRYGLGEFIRPEIVDKWSLYTIAQYCDQLVPSGYKNGDTGADLMEPRFSYNGVINNREEAYHVLQSVTTAWRGMAYWSLGQVFATADIPSDPVKIVTPANVINGEFAYSGTALKARHSVAIVKWNDPDDFYRPATELVINEEMLRRYGWREKPVTFSGCTSRGLAHRYGKWLLDVEQTENETVEYQASWDHAEVRPGDIVAIADPTKAMVRAGGRIRSYDAAARLVSLDADFDAGNGETYHLMAALPNGKLETRSIVEWKSEREVVLDNGFSEQLDPDTMYAITGTDIRPRQFRVISVREEEKNIFKVSALFHDPLKYARVEQNIKFDPLPYTRPKDISLPPENLGVKEVFYTLNGTQRSRLLFSWSPNPTIPTRNYDVSVVTPFDGEIEYGETEKTWVELNDVTPGTYILRVRSHSLSKKPSDWVEFEYEAVGPAGMRLPTVSDIRLVDRPGNEFVGRNIAIAWDNNFASSSDPTAEGGALSNEWSPFFKHNTVKVFDVKTGQLMREQSVYVPEFVYTYDMNSADAAALGLPSARRSVRFEITVTDVFDRTSVSAKNSFNNPAPAAVIPTHHVAADHFFLTFPASNQDQDFVGYMIWVEKQANYDPLVTPPVAQTTDSNVVIPGEPSTIYYCRFAAYDAFGTEDLNISPQVEIVTAQPTADFDPPANPDKPVLTSVLEKGLARLIATWPENTERDLAGYDVQIQQGTNNWLSSLTRENVYEWRVLPGLTYSVRLRAYDQSGNYSGFSEVVTHVAIKDTTPPAPPTKFEITAGLTSFWLSWVNPTDEDLSHVEILEAPTNKVADAVVIGQASGNSFARTGLDNQIARFYWLRAIDTSGNKSTLTGVKTATTAALPDAKRLQISGLVLTPNSPAKNKCSWTSFQIVVGSAVSGTVERTVVAGNATWTSGSLFLYYVEGETKLRTTNSITAMFVENGFPIAVYRGDTDLQMADGKVMMDGNNLIAGTVGAQQLVVNDAIITNSLQLKDAIVTSAKIESLEAEKIKANTTISNTIIVGGGDSLATIRDRARDPAARVNQGTTLIEPGKVKISNTGTVSDWAMGGDSTEINGGAVAANTLKANAATIGMRGITLDGLTFEHNSPSTNKVSWSTGVVAFTNDNNQSTTISISAGNATWASGTLYLYWVKGETSLRSTNNFATANGENNVILATYKGGIWLFANYGRTVIDGGQLKAQSIDTAQLKAGAVLAENMKVTTISSISSDLGAMTGGSLNINNRFIVKSNGDTIIRSSETGPRLELSSERILIVDNT